MMLHVEQSKAIPDRLLFASKHLRPPPSFASRHTAQVQIPAILELAAQRRAAADRSPQRSLLQHCSLSSTLTRIQQTISPPWACPSRRSSPMGSCWVFSVSQYDLNTSLETVHELMLVTGSWTVNNKVLQKWREKTEMELGPVGQTKYAGLLGNQVVVLTTISDGTRL